MAKPKTKEMRRRIQLFCTLCLGYKMYSEHVCTWFVVHKFSGCLYRACLQCSCQLPPCGGVLQSSLHSFLQKKSLERTSFLRSAVQHHVQRCSEKSFYSKNSVQSSWMRRRVSLVLGFAASVRTPKIKFAFLRQLIELQKPSIPPCLNQEVLSLSSA